jgi:putative FmdB family regulatory protein
VPIYDYVCSNCGHLTEVVHGIHETGPKFCPNCGAEGTMTKAFAPPTIHFKGSGWAKKDRSSAASGRSASSSSSKKDDKAAAGSGADSGSTGGSGSGSSDSSSSSGGSSSGGSSSTASTGD